jgi:mannose-6-phosphate isomerase-like protein (cupin superfamily)
MNNSQKSVALVEKMANIPWQQFPGHFGGALSKALVGPDNVGTEKIDFRISRYAPAAFVEEHVHQIQEQVYYVLEGEGVLTTDDQKHLMRPNDYVYVPPGVRHSFANTGTNGLVFLVITTPTHDGEVL